MGAFAFWWEECMHLLRENMSPQLAMEMDWGDAHLPIVRNSFANPYIWGWHRFLWWERTRRGLRY